MLRKKLKIFHKGKIMEKINMKYVAHLQSLRFLGVA